MHGPHVPDLGAEISAAFATLSDADKRSNYDSYGHEDGAAQAAAANGNGGMHHHGKVHMGVCRLYVENNIDC